MIPIRESGRIVGFGGRLLEGRARPSTSTRPTLRSTRRAQLFAPGPRAAAHPRGATSSSSRDTSTPSGSTRAASPTWSRPVEPRSPRSTSSWCARRARNGDLPLRRRRRGRPGRAARLGDRGGGLGGGARAHPSRRRRSRRAPCARGAAGVRRADPLLATFARVPPRPRAVAGREGAPPEARARAVHAVAGLVKAAPDALTRDIYVDTIAKRLGIAEDAVRRSLAGKDAAPEGSARRRARSRQPISASLLKVELVIVEAVIRHPELRALLAQSGALSEFRSAPLRDAADEICSGADAEAVIRARRAGRPARAPGRRPGGDGAGRRPVDAQRLQHLLKKHSQTMALERKGRPSPPVPTD